MNDVKICAECRFCVRDQLISEWDMDEIPTFRQGVPIHEMEGIVTAEQVTGYVKRIAELREQVRVLSEALIPLSKYLAGGHYEPRTEEEGKLAGVILAALAAVKHSG